MSLFFQRRRNQRRTGEREYLLDVKYRSNQTRAARLRILGIGVGVLFAIVAAILVCWRGGAWMLDRLVYENEAFSIEQIDVQTDGVLTSDVIRRWAVVQKGQNLMALDLMRVKRDLELQPPIQFAAVERVLPHTLKLSVTERDPIAQTIVSFVSAHGQTNQVVYDFDQDGFPLRPLDPRWRVSPPPANEGLPILVGVPPNQVEPGRQIESPQVRAALQLINEFGRSPMNGLVEMQRINVALPEILQVTTSQGSVVTFSLNNFEQQLRRWRLIYDQYQKWGKAVATADLSISNNIPVRWVAANAVPQVIPKSPKQPRTRRKNV